MTERGIVMGGRVVGGEDLVFREPDAWWRNGERGTKRRGCKPDLIVGHWTGGKALDGPIAAARVVRNMKARKRDDGTPLSVGVHFVISWDGLVWQTADLDIATIHVGSAGVNARAIGVECCWPGTELQAMRLGVNGRVLRKRVAGDGVNVLEPSDALVASWVRLANALADVIDCPRHVPLDASGALMTDRFTPKRQRGWTGAQEHLHVPGTEKVDAAGMLVGALRSAGWRGVIA